MNYTRTGRSLANVTFWFGIIQVVYTLVAPALVNFAPDGSNTIGKFIEREVSEGLTLIFYGVVLGVLCEISSSLSKPVAADKTSGS